MLFLLSALIGCLVALFALDRLIGALLRVLAHICPTDMAGPDGWLVDTRCRTGVFDRA